MRRSRCLWTARGREDRETYELIRAFILVSYLSFLDRNRAGELRAETKGDARFPCSLEFRELAGAIEFPFPI